MDLDAVKAGLLGEGRRRANASTIDSTSAVVSSRGSSCGCHVPSAAWTPHSGTRAPVAIGIDDADTIGAPLWKEECDIRPVCQSCATTVVPLAWSAPVTLDHARACSSVYMPGVSL